MKKYLLLVLILQSFYSFSQIECEYSTNVTDSLGTYKSTKDYVVHERVFGNNQTSIFFSLINAEGLASLSIQIIQKSTEFIPARCLDKNSKVFFQLSNGKVVTMLPVEQESCGNSVRNENENARILTGYFLFIKDTFEELKKSPVSLMRIKYTTETVDYVLRNELISEVDKKTYSPENYFINYLKCIE